MYLILVRRIKKGDRKRAFKWVGPRIIVRAKSPLIFEFEHIETGNGEEVHARHLLLYKADMDRKGVQPSFLESMQHLERVDQIMRNIESVRNNLVKFEF